MLRRIHLPLSRTSVLAAAILVGVDALKELPIAYLLRPVGFDTLPVWVYDLASESRFEQAALPALTIIAVALVPVAMLSRHLDQPIVDAPAATRDRPVLELRAASARRSADVAAVDGVDLAVADHELVAAGRAERLRQVDAAAPRRRPGAASTRARSASAATSSTTACAASSPSTATPGWCSRSTPCSRT